ncbi:MAG: fumarate reductase iron-sulfur subunit [Gammaproteobacteria bacterium]|nr:fumarate reductase iron-sulfur subunit [Gammaproteobacteria bacterium]
MSKRSGQKRRQLRFEIFRFNPEDPESTPHIQCYRLDETPYLSLYLALNQIREQQDASLQFDFCCRSAICGSCAMMVNGRPLLACRTLTKDLPERIQLHPLPAFALIGDLSVDTGSWFSAMNQRVAAWIHEQHPFDPDAPEEPMNDDLAQAIYEGDRCIECGCCVAGCGIANVKPEFYGAAGLNRIARFMIDPRDRRETCDWFEVVSSEEGVFGCVGLMACQDICPRNLPLLEVHAYLRRRMLAGRRC